MIIFMSPSKVEGAAVRKSIALIACLTGGFALAQSVQLGEAAYRVFKGEYTVYGGGLGDPVAPTKGDKKIAFEIQGAAAKHMFDAMGPDLKGVCGTEDGGRIRQRAEVSCAYIPQYGYRCQFGFDLISGRSIGGVIC